MKNATIDKKEVALVKSQASKAVVAVNEIEIKKYEDLTKATDVLSRIKQVQKMVREKKESITKPLNEALKNIRGLFSPIEDDVSEAEKIIKGKMVKYQEVEEKKKEAKEAKIEENLKDGKIDFEQATKKLEKVPDVNTAVKGKVGEVFTRIVKKAVIEDEAKLPREFLVPDMVKINQAVKQGLEIPGVKVVEEKIISAR